MFASIVDSLQDGGAHVTCFGLTELATIRTTMDFLCLDNNVKIFYKFDFSLGARSLVVYFI
jgi:hypothetical protein